MARIFPIILDDDLNRKIEEFMLKHGIEKKKDCILQLIKKGLSHG